MPRLERRNSNSSVASATDIRRSLPNTIASTTKVDQTKARKVMERRRKSSAPDKENVLQSPTPYWKVAKERKERDQENPNTPPETRSATKKKKKGGILLFSPPDQRENARREQEQLERKEKERYV